MTHPLTADVERREIHPAAASALPLNYKIMICAITHEGFPSTGSPVGQPQFAILVRTSYCGTLTCNRDGRPSKENRTKKVKPSRKCTEKDEAGIVRCSLESERNRYPHLLLLFLLCLQSWDILIWKREKRELTPGILALTMFATH